MNATLITNARLVDPEQCISSGSLLMQDGRIAALNPPADRCPPGAERIDARGRLLTPGLIDIHTHGVGTHQYEASPEELLAGAATLAAYGVTCVVPTVVPMPGPDMLPQLERLSKAAASSKACCIPGLHLEGPFMALTGAACKTVDGDVGLLNEMVAACGGRAPIMSLSPDARNIIPVIETACRRGMAVFMTHTRASVDETQAAVDAGARHATHFYDVFPVPPETEPGARPAGAVEVILADPRVTVDFICDGCHVHPIVIKMALAAKGPGGVALITDSNIGAGLPPGEYPTPWGYPVRVKEGDGARIADPKHKYNGALAGSALTMNKGIANLAKWLDLPTHQLWAMGTWNPARIVGLERKGVLCPGADADLVLWDDGFKPARTWVGGRCVFGG